MSTAMSIMILHLDPALPSVSVLSIPRDLFVPNARADGANKVDAALAQGPAQLVAAIEEDFAIPIQHYVELNFDTFAAVVTALGGITMEFPEPVFDAYSGLNVSTPGCHHLDGVQALQVVRARHLQYKSPTVTATTPHTWPQESESDLARIRRDHEFLRVLATEVAARGLSNPLTDERLISAVAPQLTVDSGLSASQMADLLLTYHSVSIDRSPQLTLPVSVGHFGSLHLRGRHIRRHRVPPEPQEEDTIDQFLGVTGDTDTMAGGHLPSPQAVTVSVEDGSGVPGQAGETATALGHLGFRIVGDGTTTPVGQEAETTVTYSSRSPGVDGGGRARGQVAFGAGDPGLWAAHGRGAGHGDDRHQLLGRRRRSDADHHDHREGRRFEYTGQERGLTIDHDRPSDHGVARLHRCVGLRCRTSDNSRCQHGDNSVHTADRVQSGARPLGPTRLSDQRQREQMRRLTPPR